MGTITQRSLEPSFEASAITSVGSEDGNNFDRLTTPEPPSCPCITPMYHPISLSHSLVSLLVLTTARTFSLKIL